MIRSVLGNLRRTGVLLSFPLPAVFLGTACALSGIGAGEGIFVGVLFVLACIFGAALIGTSGRITFPTGLIAYAGLPLVIVGCISALGSHVYFLMSLTGADLGVGTIGLFLIVCLVTVIASCWSRVSATFFLYAFESVVAVRALYTIAFAIIHEELLWNASVQSALCFGACALIGAMLFDQAPNVRLRLFHGIVAGVSLAGLAVSFYMSAALLTLFFAVVVLVVFWRAGMSPGFASVPVATLLLSLILAALSLFVAVHPSTAAPVSNLYPALSDSALAVGPQDLSSIRGALIGEGPSAFPSAWNEYRPSDLNATAFWKVAPESPYDTLIMLVITLGLLGLFAFLLYPLLLATAIVRRSSSVAREFRTDGGIFGALLALAFFVFAAAIFCPLGPSLFIACAAAFGSCLNIVSLSHPREYHILLARSRILACVGIGLFALALLSVCTFQLIAAHADQKGRTLSASDAGAAASEFEKAAYVWPAPEYQKDAAQEIMIAAVQKAQMQLASGSVDGIALNAAAQKADILANQSVGEDPQNADLWIARASVYLSLASIGLPGNAQKATASLKTAQLLAPTRPDILYDEAVLAIFEDNDKAARADLAQALELKPDYTGAQALLATL